MSKIVCQIFDSLNLVFLFFMYGFNMFFPRPLFIFMHANIAIQPCTGPHMSPLPTFHRKPCLEDFIAFFPQLKVVSMFQIFVILGKQDFALVSTWIAGKNTQHQLVLNKKPPHYSWYCFLFSKMEIITRPTQLRRRKWKFTTNLPSSYYINIFLPTCNPSCPI